MAALFVKSSPVVDAKNDVCTKQIDVCRVDCCGPFLLYLSIKSFCSDFGWEQSIPKALIGGQAVDATGPAPLLLRFQMGERAWVFEKDSGIGCNVSGRRQPSVFHYLC